jgi:hypothetical protein
LRNQETRERTIEAIVATVKFEIIKPGTNMDVVQRRKTLIRNAAIPNVKIEIGRAIS